MHYQNIEIHNVAELQTTEAGVTWRRFPAEVCRQLELDRDQLHCTNATGVELRFVINSDAALLQLEPAAGVCPELLHTFHVFRGGIQGTWEDHELHKYAGGARGTFVIKPSPNPDTLRKMADAAGDPWDPAVVRVIFDRGSYRIIGVTGDVQPPRREQMPSRTLLAYGSSITHGSNAYNGSSSWVATVAHQLKMDARNLGMAGSCALEPAVMDYIAEEGERGHWDLAILELGINVLEWEEAKIRQRVCNALVQVAGRNPDKPVVVISPLYCGEDFKGGKRAENWRRIIRETVAEQVRKNVTYVNGLELLGDMSLISADEMHPNIYGIRQLADRLLTVLMPLVLPQETI